MLLDIGLPQMDGFTVLRALRETDDGLPVIIVTARDSDQDRAAGLEAGADDYLTKPFGFHDLLARIRHHLPEPDQHP
jgi:DNA-binding response OmpR family regulator